MTREDAILWLKHINTREFGWDDYAMQDSQKEIRERCEQSVREAIDIAISALSIKPISVRNDGTLFINVLDAEKVHSVVVTDYGFFYKKFCEEVKQEDDSDYINDIPSEYLTEPIDLMSHEEAWEQIESDLISRAEAMAYPLGFDHYDKENGSREFICGVESYREYIQRLPSVSAERVGEWIHDGQKFKGGLDWCHCSECGQKTSTNGLSLYRFCPNCGARMENKK